MASSTSTEAAGLAAEMARIAAKAAVERTDNTRKSGRSFMRPDRRLRGRCRLQFDRRILFSITFRLNAIPNLGNKPRRDMLTIHQMDFMTRACESHIK